MGSEKRKRGGDDHEDTETMMKKKSTEPEEVEEEMEEFFAILRRIHTAVKYFEKADGSGRNSTATVKTWKPSFEVEDFAGDDGVKDTEDPVEDNLVLDLNSKPSIEVHRNNIV